MAPVGTTSHRGKGGSQYPRLLREGREGKKGETSANETAHIQCWHEGREGGRQIALPNQGNWMDLGLGVCVHAFLHVCKQWRQTWVFAG